MSDVSPSTDPDEADPEEDGSPATIEDLFADLSDLTSEGEVSETRDEVLDVKQLLVEAHDRGLIDSGTRDLRARDAAEAFVGSVIFASPLLVEDGVFDIANHLFGFTVRGVPVFLIMNTLFVVFMTYALLEWTGRNTDETALLFGRIPVRLFMTLTVSFVVAALLMTAWGRVNGWQSPVEAISRITVLWTVGTLGAALGDILADSDTTPEISSPERSTGPGLSQTQTTDGVEPTAIEERSEAVRGLSDGALMDALHEEFDDLEAIVGDFAERRRVNRIREEAIAATLEDAVDDTIQKYTSRDIAEAFVGSVFFSIPFLVEDGVFDIAEFFLSFRVGLFPVYFLVNVAFVLLMILALVYWAGPKDVKVSRPLLGFIPRRLVGTALVSFLTAASLMTMWGRVDNWEDPLVALARVSVVWTVASFGAALGDILPGESSGADINDDLEALGDGSGRSEPREPERNE
ncbi:hypothetical protein [Halorubrum sp. CSM-61]|uniref:hypothetical protein n=1 Tax=Halorubrum sp. CSM-61 TaxID=2485838 RepID=UPI000F4BBB81|nr:hypothetical protein [Halorubrum sp. CSM-61]